MSTTSSYFIFLSKRKVYLINKILWYNIHLQNSMTTLKTSVKQVSQNSTTINMMTLPNYCINDSFLLSITKVKLNKLNISNSVRIGRVTVPIIKYLEIPKIWTTTKRDFQAARLKCSWQNPDISDDRNSRRFLFFSRRYKLNCRIFPGRYDTS